MLSVIIPVYNVEKYLLECLQSVDNQTYQDMETIVVDDGSTDGSGIIADDFCKDKPRFTVYHKSNGGLMSAWMYGVNKSSGDYLAFVDSDDAVRADMFEKMMERARNTNADIVMCGRKEITRSREKDLIDKLKTLYQGYEIHEIHDHVFPSLKGDNISSARWNKVFRREVFMSNLIYCADQSRYCEDRYIVPASLLTAKCFAYIPETLYVYRMRKTANSKSPSKDLIRSLERLFQTQKKMLCDKGLLKKYGKKLELAKLDYLKLAFERNLVNSIGLRDRRTSARAILSRENRKIVLNNPSECVNKFGKALWLSARINSPFTLLVLSEIQKWRVKDIQNDWFE